MAMIVIMANGNIEHILNTIRPDEKKKRIVTFATQYFSYILRTMQGSVWVRPHTVISSKVTLPACIKHCKCLINLDQV